MLNISCNFGHKSLGLLNCVLLNLLFIQFVVSKATTTSVSSQKAEPAKLYISQHCRDLIFNIIIDRNYVFLYDQALLFAHPILDETNSPGSSSAQIKMDVCVATFAAPPGHQLMLHFMDVAIDYRPSYKSRLYVYDGFNAEVHLSPPNGIYGETKATGDTFTNVQSRDYVSRYQALTLMFQGYLDKRFFGFKALLTPFKWNYLNGSCPDDLFLCEVNYYCINKSLVCNGLPNCGERDGSDEGAQCVDNKQQYLNSYTKLNDLGLMIGCGVSVLVLILAVIWVAALILKRQRLRRDRHRLRAAVAQNSFLSDDLNSRRPPTSDNPMWFPYRMPRGLYQWMYPDSPPPAYSERGHPQPSPHEDPPPYSAEAQESGYLMANSPAQGQLISPPTNITVNPAAVHLPLNPPDYADITNNPESCQRHLLGATNATQPKEETTGIGGNNEQSLAKSLGENTQIAHNGQEIVEDVQS